MEQNDYLLDQEPNLPESFDYGSFGDRFVAAIIDGLIIGVPMIGFNFFVMGVTPLDASPNWFASGINILIGWLYDALMVSSWRQATIGKRAMNLIVTDTYQQPIGFGTASLRHFAKILSGCMLLVGYIMAAFTDRRQALHDLIASTLVLRGRTYID
jgi:uncharacterized RDD family membrane protein YckC